MNRELYEFWKSEEERSFAGWDFSSLNERWEEENLPWDYKQIILEHLKSDDFLLDMGTGGGEFLLTLNHPYNKTAVTEGYEPNYKLCIRRLAPLGIDVQSVDERDEIFNFDDNTFDIVINRHESFSYEEVRRVLKPDGIFITQQVGESDTVSLSKELIAGFTTQFTGWNMNNVKAELMNHGFDVLSCNESFPYLRYFDVGAIVYYAKIIEWQFPGFSVDKCSDKLLELHEKCQEKGYVETNQHRFILVCKNEK